MVACAICEKTYSYGSSQSHRRGVAGKRWAKRAQETKRTFSPNLQMKRLSIGGVEKRLKICTKCLKAIRKYGSVDEYSSISVI